MKHLLVVQAAMLMAIPFVQPSVASALTCEELFTSYSATTELMPVGNRAAMVQSGRAAAEPVFDALVLVEPYYHPRNPETSEVPLWSMEHSFATPFEFSPDGKALAVRHRVFPKAEQVSLYQVNSGDRLQSVLWKSADDNSFELRTVAVDSVNKRIAALADTLRGEMVESVLTSRVDTGDVAALANYQVMVPTRFEYQRTTHEGYNHDLRTGISWQHPYYVSTRMESDGSRRMEAMYSPRLYSTQIVNWHKRLTLNLPNSAKNYLEVLREPVNAHFGYVAIVKADATEVELRSFASLERQMNMARVMPRAAGEMAGRGLGYLLRGEFDGKLKHDEAVERVVLSTWSPTVITKTKNSVYIWDARTGKLLDRIVEEASVQDIRVFEKAGIVAYTLGGKRLRLYSLTTKKVIQEYTDFSWWALESQILERKSHPAGNGALFIVQDTGRVTYVVEMIPPGGRVEPRYEFLFTGIELARIQGHIERSYVATERGGYFVQVSKEIRPDARHSDQLLIEAYATYPSGRKALTERIPMGAFQSQFKMDPTGQTVAFTTSATQTGILDLRFLLESRAL